jgi:acetylornithine deacetylase/succinyl-diaminopimelate desuccinylase-like protein
LGTKGVERNQIVFHGQEAHSGSTPMRTRRDALAAAAKLALEIRKLRANIRTQSAATIGSVKTFPGIVTAVVGRCEATLDQRDLDATALADMYREARDARERFAQEERCTVEWSPLRAFARRRRPSGFGRVLNRSLAVAAPLQHRVFAAITEPRPSGSGPCKRGRVS